MSMSTEFDPKVETVAELHDQLIPTVSAALAGGNEEDVTVLINIMASALATAAEVRTTRDMLIGRLDRIIELLEKR